MSNVETEGRAPLPLAQRGGGALAGGRLDASTSSIDTPLEGITAVLKQRLGSEHVDQTFDINV